jgi:cytochrome P450
VQDLVDAIPEDGIVNLQPLFFKLTFDTTMFLLFGNSVSVADWDQVAGQESEFSKAFNLSQDYLSHRGRLGAFYWLLSDKAFRDACKTCHQVVDAAIAKALEASAKGRRQAEDAEDDGNYVFVEALVQQTRDPRVLRDQCLNVLLAGRDTTACCLSWTVYVGE